LATLPSTLSCENNNDISKQELSTSPLSVVSQLIQEQKQDPQFWTDRRIIDTVVETTFAVWKSSEL